MSGGKSHMRSEHVDEALLVKYLLGSLTDEEQVEIENRAFEDSNYMAALDAIEAELIDAYVRAQLSQAERRAFERRFLMSPGRRNKVEFAKALASIASESQADTPIVTWQTVLGFVRGWKPIAQVAAAMTILILVVGGSWLIIQNAAMRSRLTLLEAQRRQFEIRQKELRPKLAVQSPGRQSPAPGMPSTPAVASLVFLPGLTRAENRVEQLQLSPSVQIVHVEIQLEARDDYPRFRTELHTRSGKDILSEDNLPRRRTDAGYSVIFDMPASALPAGQYELALKGILNNQSVQDIGYYYFSVVF
jgi:hypothetical protein